MLKSPNLWSLKNTFKSRNLWYLKNPLLSPNLWSLTIENPNLKFHITLVANKTLFIFIKPGMHLVALFGLWQQSPVLHGFLFFNQRIGRWRSGIGTLDLQFSKDQSWGFNLQLHFSTETTNLPWMARCLPIFQETHCFFESFKRSGTRGYFILVESTACVQSANGEKLQAHKIII